MFLIELLFGPPGVQLAIIGTIAAAVVGSAASAAAGEALREDPQGIPEPGQGFGRAEFLPGLQATFQGGALKTQFPEAGEERINLQRQALEDLLGSFATTSEDRQQELEETKEAFLEQFEANVEEDFQRQRERLRAQQARTGRNLSSVGREQRGQLLEDQAQQFRQAGREAQLLQRRLRRQDVQERANLTELFRRGLQQDFGRARATARAARGIGDRQFQQELAASQASGARTARENQLRFSELAAGAQAGGQLGADTFEGDFRIADLFGGTDGRTVGNVSSFGSGGQSFVNTGTAIG